mgnify:CR=1 FL=1
MSLLASSLFFVFAVVGGVHLLWALRIWWPIRDAALLARCVVGTRGITRMPTAAITFAVVGLIVLGMVWIAVLAGWAAPPMDAWLEQAVNDASQAYFSRPAMYMGCGGTIPFMKMLGDAYPGVQFMVTGVLGPKSNAHGPNEFLEIATGKRVTACVADVLADHARR